MGCTPSRGVESDGVVARCRDRKRHISAAVKARHDFAEAHFSHAETLRNVGSALSDYANGEAHDGLLRSSSAPVPTDASSSHSFASAPTTMELPPAPPPPPYDIVQAQTLARSISTPVLPVQSQKMKDPDNSDGAPSMIPEEEDGEEDVESVTTDQGTEIREHTATSTKPASSSTSHVSPPPPVPPNVEDAPQPLSPPVPEAPHGMQGRWDFFFGTHDSVLPTTLETELAEPSWMQETREMEADKTPPPPETKQPEPQPIAEVSASVKAPAPEAVVQAQLPPKPVRRSRNGSGVGGGNGGGSTGASSSSSSKGRLVPVRTQTANLVVILNKLDHHFLEASQSTFEVSKMLEAARVHYHSNFADSRG